MFRCLWRFISRSSLFGVSLLSRNRLDVCGQRWKLDSVQLRRWSGVCTSSRGPWIFRNGTEMQVGAFGADMLFAVRIVVWKAPYVAQWSMSDAVVYKRRPLRADAYVADPSLILPGIVEAFDVEGSMRVSGIYKMFYDLVQWTPFKFAGELCGN